MRIYMVKRPGDGARSSRRATRGRVRLVAAGVALATVCSVFSPLKADAQVVLPPSPGDEITVEPEGIDPPDGGDPWAPAVALPSVIAGLEKLLARTPSTDTVRVAALRAAIAELRTAIEEHTDGSTDLDAVAAALGRATGLLAEIRPASDAEAGFFRSTGRTLSRVARVMAVRVIEVAGRAGVADPVAVARRDLAVADQLAAAGNFAGAIESYGKALAPKGAVEFSMDLFERNIRTAVGPFVSGFAFTINQAGNFVREGFGGWARTSADPPETPHSPLREQVLASVSKTITGVAMLRALQDANIPVSTPISGFLPANWARGPNANQLTFEQLLTHESDLCSPCPGANNLSSQWAGLRTRISQPFVLPSAYDYENANFGLMRILIPRVHGFVGGQSVALADQTFVTDADRALAHATSFENYVRARVFAPMGIDGRCSSSASPPTLLYFFPHADQPGWDEASQLLGCGGFGWNLSSRELGAFMAHLRYTETVLSAETRKAMDTGFFGWADPSQRSYATGAFGTYHSHAGDWTRPTGEAHTCIMKFPINVEVSLVINSQRGFSGSQCTVLRNAFDASWIPA